MKHVKIDRNLIKREIYNGGISLAYISSTTQKADILTKVTLKSGFEFQISKL